MPFCSICHNLSQPVELNNTIKYECRICCKIDDSPTTVLYHTSASDDTLTKFDYILKQIAFQPAAMRIRKTCPNDKCKSPYMALYRTKGDERVYHICHCGTIQKIQ